jgi:hypothetical protein
VRVKVAKPFAAEARLKPRRIETRRKIMEEKFETLYFWSEGEEHLIVRRFPGKARLSF